MHYNIIGDIHGRDTWKQLIKDDCFNIFLGDYLDPYPSEGISDEDAWNNFVEILNYRNQYPDTTFLLWGNHDLHYIFPNEHYSRYNTENAQRMRALYETRSLKDLQLSYCIGDHTLITHAGVTKEWWQMVCNLMRRDLPATPEMVARVLRTFNEGSPELQEQLFGTSAWDADDICGESATASPIWVRPETLVIHNLFADTDYKQIVGHTQIEEPVSVAGITFVDCLGRSRQSYLCPVKQ